MGASYDLAVVTCPSCGQQNPDGARFRNADLLDPFWRTVGATWYVRHRESLLAASS